MTALLFMIYEIFGLRVKCSICFSTSTMFLFFDKIRLVVLSTLSVPTLCLKDPPIGDDTIDVELLMPAGMVRWNKLYGC